MKIDKKTTNYISNIEESQSDNFSFHDEGIIMSLLQDKMYQRKLYTPLQEILSNARDAVRERHLLSLDSERTQAMSETDIRFKIAALYMENKHVDVTLPTGLNPVLIIRDYGVGISPERITLIRKVGFSTKNTSNIPNGGFGLGLKSLFAYTEQFFIVSFYEGTEYTYVCQKNVNKMGALVLLNERESSEQNGVEIRIPIKEDDLKKLTAHVSEIVRFWETRPTINGVVQENTDDLLKLESGGVISNTSYHLIVTDGMPYQLDLYKYYKPNELITLFAKDYKIVLFFETGELDLVMTREGLEDSEKNKELIAKRIKDLQDEIGAYCRLKTREAQGDLDIYSRVYEELNRRFALDRVLNREELRFEIVRENFKVSVSEDEVSFLTLKEGDKIKFDSITYSNTNIRKKSTSRFVILRSDDQFKLVGIWRQTFFNMSICDSVADKRINHYSDRKKREIYSINRDILDKGYVLMIGSDPGNKDLVRESIITYLKNCFSLPNVEIIYPGNLTALDDLNILCYTKKTNVITYVEKSCKRDGRTKFTRYRSSPSELSTICNEVDIKYSIDKERFFSLLRSFNIELVYTKEDLFPVFKLETLDNLFNSNVDKLLDKEEAVEYFIRIHLKNVQKNYSLWLELSKRDPRQIELENETVNNFITEEFHRITKPESTWNLTPHQKFNIESKTSYYNNLFLRNKEIYVRMAVLFPNALKTEKILKSHPIIKDSAFSYYYISSDNGLLLNNYVTYINNFFGEVPEEEAEVA